MEEFISRFKSSIQFKIGQYQWDINYWTKNYPGEYDDDVMKRLIRIDELRKVLISIDEQYQDYILGQKLNESVDSMMATIDKIHQVLDK